MRFKRIILFLLSVWLILCITKQVDLTRTDIGRHLKNGEMICQNIYQTFLNNSNKGILNSNYYSFTHPEFPVVNHHWGSGVIFYIVHKYFGFQGLNVFYTTIILIAFLLFFKSSEKRYGFYPAFLASVIVLPLITDRFEIRPEAFSYLFCALFYFEFKSYTSGDIKIKRIYLLTIYQVLWVNIHIYFVFGLFIAILFLFEEFVRRSPKFKEMIIPIVLLSSASLLSPFGLKGIIYPFTIFKNYGYRVAENQSVAFLENYGLNNPSYFMMKFALVVLVLSILAVIVKNIKKTSIANLVLSGFFAVLAWSAVRNFSIFGFFAIPAISGNIYMVFQKNTGISRNLNTVFMWTAVVIFVMSNALYNKRNIFPYSNFGIGLIQGEDSAAMFFTSNKLKGPIFNNYDIGGYLIYYLYPSEKVFVDNRPEAYPKAFFENEYIPMQENSLVFLEKDKKYKFNAIFFSVKDLTPWGQKFLIDKVNDNSWAPVYADALAIIFLKRNDTNKSLIQEYEVPKSRFSVSKW